MLDYAANAVLYWPVELVISSFEATARKSGREPQAVLREFLATDGVEHSEEDFWTRVKTNLEAERVRMVFVADVIPRELRRIIEFLNAQMNPAEVIAIEVKQYVGENIQTLVPRVVGQTIKSTAKSSPRVTQDWDEASYRERVMAVGGQVIERIASQIVVWFKANAAGVRWGRGKEATFTARVLVGTRDVELLRVGVDGSMGVSFDQIPNAGLREEFRKRLGAIEELEFSAAEKFAKTSLKPLANPQAWHAFTVATQWLVDSLKARPE